MLKSLGGSNKSTLFARWIVINSLFTALFTVAFMHGLLDTYLVDETYITHFIVGITSIIILWSGWVSRTIGAEWKSLPNTRSLYRSSRGSGAGEDFKESMAERAQSKLSIFRLFSPFIVGVGLLGTVLGISNAFSTISPDVIADVQASTGVMAVLLAGLATAFHTTLAGLVGMLWNMINVHLMNQESSRHYAAVIGE